MPRQRFRVRTKTTSATRAFMLLFVRHSCYVAATGNVTKAIPRDTRTCRPLPAVRGLRLRPGWTGLSSSKSDPAVSGSSGSVFPHIPRFDIAHRGRGLMVRHEGTQARRHGGRDKAEGRSGLFALVAF